MREIKKPRAVPGPRSQPHSQVLPPFPPMSGLKEPGNEVAKASKQQTLKNL